MATTISDQHLRARSQLSDLGQGFSFDDWRDLPPMNAVRSRTQEIQAAGVGMLERLAALVLLVVLMPLLLLVAVAVKIDSPRAPVLYCQERVGLDRRRRADGGHEGPDGTDRRRRPGVGKVFKICKFRTMIPNAESGTGPVWAKDNDPRVTRLGKHLRHLRMDELPQLLNILRGEMRLIGPRPERPVFVERFVAEIPEYQRRQTVPPGITGLAQIERQYDATVDDVRTKVKYDLFYVKNRSTLLDVKILARTLDVMLRGRGAR